MRTLERTATRYRPTVAVVDLEAIRHNVRAVKPVDADVMAVVKADGYGHGAVRAAGAALDAGATWLGVASVEEGIELRRGGVDGRVLVLSELAPGSEGGALAAELTPSLYTAEGLGRLAKAAGVLGVVPGVHVKVDTGMHRVGLPPDQAVPFVRSVVEGGLEVEGLWTHFAKADEPEDPFTDVQLRRFNEVVDRVRASGVRPRLLHAANSAAALLRPDTHFDLVRLGIAIYGVAPAPGLASGLDLRPSMSWKSAVTMVKRVRAGEAISYGLLYRLERPAWVATVPVGYADGYRRGLSREGHVLIRGRRHRIAGAVTMDQLMVDCGDEEVAVGDEVVLFGRQGDQEIPAEELAAQLGTIAYEVLCGVGVRVPREYVDGDAPPAAG